MNKIWLAMMIMSIAILLFNGPSSIMSVMINASDQALKLCLELCGVYAVWLGILELVEKSGLGDKLAKALRPIIKRLFKIDNADTERMIALNMSANILGLGNAATPIGIKAMQALDDGSGVATTPMIMLIVLNATSLQLLPSTVIGLRTAAGSTSASDIILPTILSTIVTSALGVILVKIISNFKEKHEKIDKKRSFLTKKGEK